MPQIRSKPTKPLCPTHFPPKIPNLPTLIFPLSLILEKIQKNDHLIFVQLPIAKNTTSSFPQSSENLSGVAQIAGYYIEKIVFRVFGGNDPTSVAKLRLGDYVD